MCIYKSYFEKTNTIISNSSVNTAKNQVTELVYGGDGTIISRFIFKIDLNNLLNKITAQEISSDKIIYHKLKLFNTINGLDGYSGNPVNQSENRLRASSFKLILFKINEEWDEGIGYDILFNPIFLNNPKYNSPSNWYKKNSIENWSVSGIYDTPEIISVIDFDNGDENIDIDITNHINDIIYNGFEDNGLGIAFSEEFENIEDDKLYSVGFHSKYTFTIYEPHLETKLNLDILDDRNCFKLDELNRLYFYAKRGQNLIDITPIMVKIYNHKYELIDIIESEKIIKQSKGIYYIELEYSSEAYINSVIFTDEWVFLLNDEEKSIQNEFYLIENTTNYYIENVIPKNILNITFSGILNKQKIKRGSQLTIDLLLKKLYNQNNSNPLDIEYRLYIPKSDKTEFDVIEYSKVNRAPNKYFILLDTSILIPSIYKLEIKLINIDYVLNCEEIEFTIVD